MLPGQTNSDRAVMIMPFDRVWIKYIKRMIKDQSVWCFLSSIIAFSGDQGDGLLFTLNVWSGYRRAIVIISLQLDLTFITKSAGGENANTKQLVGVEYIYITSVLLGWAIDWSNPQSAACDHLLRKATVQLVGTVMCVCCCWWQCKFIIQCT